jgi:hypothetical protein
MNTKSVHAHSFMFLTCTPGKQLPLTCHFVMCCHWISHERRKLGMSCLQVTVVHMEMPEWVPAVSEGGWNILRTETQTSPISCIVVNWEQAKSRWAHQTRLKDNSRRNRSKGWSEAPCSPGDGEDFVIGKFVPAGFPICLWAQGNTKWLETALLSTLQSEFGPLRLPLVQALEKIACNHYKTDMAVQEVVQSWLWGAGMEFYHRGTFKILQHWQKCIDRNGDFAKK